MLADEVTKVKSEVDDTLDRCGAVVIRDEHDDACFTGLGQEPVTAVFKPLQSGPSLDVPSLEQIELGDLELNPVTLNTIQTRAKALFYQNNILKLSKLKE